MFRKIIKNISFVTYTRYLVLPGYPNLFSSESRYKGQENNFKMHITDIGYEVRSRDSSVVYRWAMGWMIGCSCPGRAWKVQFSLHHRVQTGSGVHPVSYPMSIKGSFPWGKVAGREADHSLPSSAEVKNAWSYAFTPPIRLHGAVLT
jgi:hypothetical protein